MLLLREEFVIACNQVDNVWLRFPSIRIQSVLRRAPLMGPTARNDSLSSPRWFKSMMGPQTLGTSHLTKFSQHDLNLKGHDGRRGLFRGVGTRPARQGHHVPARSPCGKDREARQHRTPPDRADGT